jgi:hypothetical protein
MPKIKEIDMKRLLLGALLYSCSTLYAQESPKVQIRVVLNLLNTQKRIFLMELPANIGHKEAAELIMQRSGVKALTFQNGMKDNVFAVQHLFRAYSYDQAIYNSLYVSETKNNK